MIEVPEMIYLVCFKNFFEVFVRKEIQRLKNSIEYLRNNSNMYEDLYDDLISRYFINDKKQFNNYMSTNNSRDTLKKQDKNNNIRKKLNKVFDYFCMCFGFGKNRNYKFI